ncbi:MAG: hypothetical protein HDT13_04665 [Butyrivibrio sp.]|nr:hypothetical protein [Butyrivibrio sp.]
MKRTSLIITLIILTFSIIGCTKGSYTSSTVDLNQTRESITTDDKETVTEKATEEPTTEYIRVEYNPDNARKEFEESDIPGSIKKIFLSDGEFIDTQTRKEMKLSEYKLYDIIYSYDEHYDVEAETYDLNKWREVFEWLSYIAVDFDGDGKKELFYAVNGGTNGVIFHENSDGKVYAYRHPSLRVNVSKDGDVLATAGATSPDWLLRYSFNTDNIIETIIAYARQQENGEYKYYAEGREVNLAEFETYFRLLSEGSLKWTEFRITPDSEENQTSLN